MTIKRKILIVDDEEAIRNLVARTLGKDYDCHTACEGNEALAMLQADDYDIVLTDLNMPGMGGLELCKFIISTYPTIAIVIVTGFPQLLQEAESMRLSVFCVTKPFTSRQIREVVAEALASRDAYELQLQSRPETPDELRWPADAKLG